MINVVSYSFKCSIKKWSYCVNKNLLPLIANPTAIPIDACSLAPVIITLFGYLFQQTSYTLNLYLLNIYLIFSLSYIWYATH